MSSLALMMRVEIYDHTSAFEYSKPKRLKIDKLYQNESQDLHLSTVFCAYE